MSKYLCKEDIGPFEHILWSGIGESCIISISNSLSNSILVSRLASTFLLLPALNKDYFFSKSTQAFALIIFILAILTGGKSNFRVV